MARRKQFDIDTVIALKAKASRYTVTDPHQPGLYVRVTPRGVKSFVVVTTGPGGKQVFDTIGTVEEFKTIEEARAKARDVIGKIKRGESRILPQSFPAVADEWFKRYVEGERRLRSASRIRRDLDRCIVPEWKDRIFTDIDRADIAALLDKIVENSGLVAADKALAHISNLCAWYATRNAKYVSPIVRGMRRSKPAERARERILDDDELRTIWYAAAANGQFGAFVRILLLTGQRRDKVASMKWNDVTIDGTWMIQAEAREKSNAKELALPKVALEIIKDRPRLKSNPYIFAGRAGSYFSGYSKAKATFDAQAGIKLPWRLHDLRRTARSLMSRAGVRPDISERVLGHAITGVEGVYDRHDYREEKAHALKALAAQIESIVNPPEGNVVKFG